MDKNEDLGFGSVRTKFVQCPLWVCKIIVQMESYSIFSPPSSLILKRYIEWKYFGSSCYSTSGFMLVFLKQYIGEFTPVYLQCTSENICYRQIPVYYLNAHQHLLVAVFLLRVEWFQIKYNKLGRICGKYNKVMLLFLAGYLVQNRKN